MTVEIADVTQLARIAKALSDPIRLKMIGILAEGRDCCELPDLCTRNVPGTGIPAGICVCEFQQQFGLGQSRTSYNLRVLKEAGLVTEETRGKWTFYELDRGALAAALHALQGLAGE
jgi:ArsR family transcriptional regulator